MFPRQKTIQIGSQCCRAVTAVPRAGGYRLFKISSNRPGDHKGLWATVSLWSHILFSVLESVIRSFVSVNPCLQNVKVYWLQGIHFSSTSNTSAVCSLVQFYGHFSFISYKSTTDKYATKIIIGIFETSPHIRSLDFFFFFQYHVFKPVELNQVQST